MKKNDDEEEEIISLDKIIEESEKQFSENHDPNKKSQKPGLAPLKEISNNMLQNDDYQISVKTLVSFRTLVIS